MGEIILETIYNIMAVLINKVNLSNKYDDFFTKSKKVHDSAVNEIKQKIPEIFLEDGSLEIDALTIDIIKDNNFIVRLKHLANEYIREENSFKLLKLLQVLDSSIKNLIKISCEDDEGYKEIIALNTNYDDTDILLLPYVKCFWKRHSNGSQHGYKINHCLQNTYYIIKSDLKDLTVKHLYLNEALFLNAIQNKRLKVACSPVTNNAVIDKIETIEDVEGNSLFFISKIKNKELIQKKILEIIEEAKRRNVDILVFPEILGFEELTMEAIELITNNILENYPPLIVLPTVWKDYSNASDVIIENGRLIIKQAKQNPMNFNGANEYIIPDKILYVIHAFGIGRICILICKDMLVFDYLDIILEDVQASLIIVPSFSTGNYDFQNAIARCQAYDCDVVWINSCAAIHLAPSKTDNFKIIGIILESGKGSNNSVNFCQNEKCKNCDLRMCMFEHEIRLDYNRSIIA